jgi:hypothetical protein
MARSRSSSPAFGPARSYEELLIGNSPTATGHPRIMMASEHFLPLAELEAQLAKLAAGVENHDVPALRALLQQLVVDYAAAPDVVDWVAMKERQARGSAEVVPFERVSSTS